MIQLGMYQKKRKILIWKDALIPMFIATLFTINKMWKQPKCPSTDEWWYSVKKRKWNFAIYSNMSGHGEFYVNTEKSKRCVLSLICAIWEINEQIKQIRNKFTDTENKLAVISGEWEGRRARLDTVLRDSKDCV